MAVWCLFNDTSCQKCNEQIKELRGCEREISPVRLIGTDITVTRCPMSYITAKEELYLELYLQWEKGYLPNAGGWLDQPFKYAQAMILIDNLIGTFRKEKEQWQALKT